MSTAAAADDRHGVRPASPVFPFFLTPRRWVRPLREAFKPPAPLGAGCWPAVWIPPLATNVEQGRPAWAAPLCGKTAEHFLSSPLIALNCFSGEFPDGRWWPGPPPSAGAAGSRRGTSGAERPGHDVPHWGPSGASRVWADDRPGIFTTEILLARRGPSPSPGTSVLPSIGGRLVAVSPKRGRATTHCPLGARADAADPRAHREERPIPSDPAAGV